jgi:hypothetical protein
MTYRLLARVQAYMHAYTGRYGWDESPVIVRLERMETYLIGRMLRDEPTE